jgi:hypothetical protein
MHGPRRRHLTPRRGPGIDRACRGRRDGRTAAFHSPTRRNPNAASFAPPWFLMLSKPPPRREYLEVAETLAIAAAGGITFALLGVSAGLVS